MIGRWAPEAFFGAQLCGRHGLLGDPGCSRYLEGMCSIHGRP